MSTIQLIKRSLAYYWGTNLTIVLGVSTAVAVLAGALLVGDSVRASLRDLFLQRLGSTDFVVSSAHFFRDALAGDLTQDQRFKASGFNDACPLVVLRGSAVHEQSRRQGGQITVYGVDERFWNFHGHENIPLGTREVAVGEDLARELGSQPGESLLLRIEKPSDIPVESLHGRKEDQGRTLRLTVRSVLPRSQLGEFSLLPQQGTVRALFLPLDFLQRELAQPGKVNTILISEGTQKSTPSEGQTKLAGLQQILHERAALGDFGVELRIPGEKGSIVVESQSRVLSDSVAETAMSTARQMSLRSMPVLAYLANSISSGERSIPYSLVTALDKESLAQLSRDLNGASGSATEPPPIVLNDWAAQDLSVHPGDPISLEYYLWHEDGHLETKTAQFRLAAVVPIAGLAADRDLVPQYPGITESQHLSDWDPPFPIDLSRVRKKDEDYWDQYRTTPKAFIQLERAQELWPSRFGKLTSIRILYPSIQQTSELKDTYAARLRAGLAPVTMGLQIFPARDQGLQASRGATDFGEYFLYFSFFLVVSALLLTTLFFRLAIEQRVREVGTLEAMGFQPARIRNLFLIEGSLLAVLGSILGLIGAIVYGYLLMLGLRTWWVEAVGTTILRLHVSWFSLLIGALAGVVSSLLCIALTLRRLGQASARSHLMGTGLSGREKVTRKFRLLRSVTSFRLALLFSLGGVGLLIAASLKLIGQVAGFFGGGTLLLIGLLCYESYWLRRDRGKSIFGNGVWPLLRLGFRNATHRPGRSILCIALIASAAFIIVSVDAFRRSNSSEGEKSSGTGGFQLLAESLLPLVHNPNSNEGREALNLGASESSSDLKDVSFTRFRVRAGDDASCLNLYEPRNPTIIAAADDFIQSNRFFFQDSLSRNGPEKSNSWLLLNEALPDGSIPVIGDANSLTYVLHLKLGDELVVNQGATPVKLRVVASLADSIFQSQLVMSEKNFLRVFPQEQGYKFFLIETGNADPAKIAAVLEDRLSDYGFDAMSTVDRLAEFHRVENTYLSTFQLLGGLGLVLGTLGLAAVLFRNVLERRRELALLRAVGYNSSHFTLMVFAENIFLLFCGLVTGTACALLAVAPVFFGRGGRLPNVSLGVLLLLVLVSGLAASLAATIAALRSPLIPALKAE
jgi:ABC-type antimicrobial peptide transport system permease subunit